MSPPLTGTVPNAHHRVTLAGAEFIRQPLRGARAENGLCSEDAASPSLALRLRARASPDSLAFQRLNGPVADPLGMSAAVVVGAGVLTRQDVVRGHEGNARTFRPPASSNWGEFHMDPRRTAQPPLAAGTPVRLAATVRGL
jgi:hypothetical protein